ncbi:TetR/AcrR family transcriptional regulator [Hoeflea sp. WL0058]|uniref:TetR/AcrR family transcriptional regulator n=1 Tax=Flavimaribacter sediminis TaxID=2865987 RepID=A0AAE2ZM12_9HYPH|nr:TetR/AcrR family transcriptional regulator [Flavimaribacter sediminis]MBW8636955.1 TetR/AcrR family transcriptional regulator [Flavimaribacter sediminis]
MDQGKRAQRARQIENAAYELLEKRGYSGTSMLSVARHAKASNETLYRWYGDKRGLFISIVENNAAATRQKLEAAIGGNADPLMVLEEIAPVLLSMLLGKKAVSLNRAAAADESGELGLAIAAAGRGMVYPLICRLMERGIQTGALKATSSETAADWFLNLLIGDLQIRRVIHALEIPTEQDLQQRVDTAIFAFKKLCETS